MNRHAVFIKIIFFLIVHYHYKSKKMKSIHLLIFLGLNVLSGCRSTGLEIFGKKSPHENYAQKLKDAGLQETALGKAWFTMSDYILQQPVSIELPFREAGYFPGEKALATAYLFESKRGEVINVTLEILPANEFEIFMDFWRLSRDSIPEKLTYADSGQFKYEVEDDGRYILRLQPELLKSGNYTLTITSGPSLAYPLPGKESIQSFWGASRDGGNRSHEGVDIFADRGTPVIAVADGRVNRAGLNNLGGKVIFLRPKGRNLSLYYAHLDSQLVQTGQTVNLGDTIGLVGNSGNAVTTAPHLHFGIYSTRGAIDPLPFIKINNRHPAPINLSTNKLGKYARTINQTIIKKAQNGYVKILPHTLIYIQAIAANQFKIQLPDSLNLFVAGNQVTELEALRKLILKNEAIVYHQPHEKALQIGTVSSGDVVSIKANFDNYYFISHANGLEGWLKQ